MDYNFIHLNLMDLMFHFLDVLDVLVKMDFHFHLLMNLGIMEIYFLVNLVIH